VRRPLCLWQLQPGSPGYTRATLILLPHAGGSAQSFAAWDSFFPDDIAIVAVQYPGRASRSEEPSAADIGDIVDEVAQAARDLDGQLYVFGHSLGSAIGFELCWRLQHAGRTPGAFFASSAMPPHLHRPEPMFDAGMSDAELLGLLKLCNGMPGDIGQYPEMLARALSVLRADIALFASYYYGQERRLLDVPVVAFGGDRDPLVPTDDLRRWSELGKRENDTHVFSGGHFYYLENMVAVAASIGKYLAYSRGEQGTSKE
jgi:pyochelin biosynthetic protein PchC